ncbi:MAG: hypothetical protein ACXADA_17665 [Candidatus Hodarchaeales archaeon]|jgi:chromosome segregation ATPase
MIEEITEEQLEQLKGVARQAELKNEMEKVTTEIEELKIRQEIEESDLSKEIGAAEKRIDDIKKELADLTLSHPFIELGEKRKTNIKRMRALEEKKGKVSESVFNRLKNEYEEKIRATESQFQEEMAKMRKLEVASRDFTGDINEKKEELQVRKELGELTEEELAQKLADFDKQKEKATIVKRAVTKLIDMYEYE